MRYVDSNIFISNLIGDKRLGKAAQMYLEALSMVKKNWKPRDAIHCVTMKKNGIEEIVTDDSHFDNVEGIKRIDILKLLVCIFFFIELFG